MKVETSLFPHRLNTPDRPFVRTFAKWLLVAVFVWFSGDLLTRCLRLNILPEALAGLRPAMPNVPLGLSLLAVSLLLLFSEQDKYRWSHWISRGGALLVTLLGSLTLGEYLFGWDARIDQLVCTTAATVAAGVPPGRMTPEAALGFALLGAGVILVSYPWAVRAAQFLSALALVLIPLSVWGRWADNMFFRALDARAPQSVAAILAFAILGLALFMVRGKQGLKWWELFRPTSRPSILEGAVGLAPLAENSQPLAEEKKSFEHGLLVLSLAVSLVIVIFGLLYYRSQQEQIRTRIYNELLAVADLKVNQVAAWREERTSDARLVAESSLYVRYMAELQANPADGEARKILTSYFEALLRSYPSYEGIALFGPEGRLRLPVPANIDAGGPELGELLSAAAGNADVQLSDLHVGADGRVHLDTVIPIRCVSQTGGPGKFVGTVLLQINPYHYLYPMIRSWPTASRTAETLLLRRVGDSVLYLSTRHNSPGPTKWLERSAHEMLLPAALGVSGNFTPLEGIDYTGHSVLAVTRPIPRSPWYLQAKVDQQEIFAPLRAQASIVIGVTGALLLMTAALAAFFWHRNSINYVTRIQEAEKSRNAMTRRLAMINRYANDMIVIFGNDSRILEANDRTLETYGYTLEELRALPPGGLRDPSDQARYAEQRAGVHSATGAIFEAVHRRKDGGKIAVEFSGRAMEIEGKTFIFAIIRDITARKAEQEKLIYSERMLRESQETANIGHYINHLVEDRWECSPVMDQIFGIDGNYVHDINGWAALVHPADRERAFAHFRDIVARRQPFRLDYRIIRPCDGGLRWLAAYGKLEFDETGLPVRLVGCIQDITERKLVEAELRKLSQAVEQSPVSIVITDLEAKIRYVNPHLTKASGYTLKEVIGKNPKIFHSRETPAETYQAMWQALTAGQTWRGEFVNKRKNGERLVESVVIAPVLGSDGQPTHYLAIKEDITERKSIEAQFLHAQRMEAIGSLAGGIAHDLNNILSPVMLMSGLLQGSLQNLRDKEIMSTMQTEVRRGAEIVRQLLTFSRGLGGEKVTMQLRHLVSDVMAMMRETFPREIELQLSVPPSLWTVSADSTQMHQVILNLCVNARDAMPQGGRLTIRGHNANMAEGDPALPDKVQAGTYVVLEVSDTGHGISPEHLARIFEPFFTTKPIGKGTGLGLSTLMGIVRNHGGFVRVDSAVGQGTTFHVYLPAIPDGTFAAPPAEAATKVSAQNELILVVDDEQSIRKASQLVLEEQGYRVMLAENGEDGLVRYLQHRHELMLVITDLMMPVMNGPKFIRSLRTLDPDMPVVAFSGATSTEVLVELDALGIVDVLSKPFSGKRLVELVHSKITPAALPS